MAAGTHPELTDIVFAEHRPLAALAVARLYDRAGLRRPTSDLDRMQRMLDGADVLITAWDDERLVGLARTLTDHSFCAYLSDLAVDPDYQGIGIGRELIRQTREAVGPEAMLLLLAAPEAHTYYPHVGFTKVDNAWSLPRER